MTISVDCLVPICPSLDLVVLTCVKRRMAGEVVRERRKRDYQARWAVQDPVQRWSPE